MKDNKRNNIVEWTHFYGIYWKQNGLESEEPTLNAQGARWLYLMTGERNAIQSVDKANRYLWCLPKSSPFLALLCKGYAKGEHRWDVLLKKKWFETLRFWFIITFLTQWRFRLHSTLAQRLGYYSFSHSSVQ